MSRHVSVEVLALRREVGVSAAKAARIDAHLAQCTRCSGIDAALTRQASVLAATQLPPVPEAFSARIQLAISRESAARAAAATAGPASAAREPARSAGASSGAGPVATGTAGADLRTAGEGVGLGAAGARGATGSTHVPGRPDLPERGRSRWSPRFRMPNWSSPLVRRGLAAAAAVVVIAGAGILLANARTASENSAGSASAPGTARPSVHSGIGRHASFGAVAQPVTVSYRLKGKIATAAAVVGHTNMTEKSLPDMVRKRVASVTSLGGMAPNSQGAASPTSLIGGVSVSALEGCLSAMAAGRQVLLADVTRFLGRPATIIVLKSPTAANVLDVAIVGLGCSPSNLEVIRMLTVPVR